MKRTAKTLLVGTVGAACLFLASTTTANASTTVKVNKNDTVWALSQKYGVSIQAIETLNHVNQNSHLILQNQSLQIPDKAAKNTANTSKTTATSSVSVKAGDSLWAIAKEYNISVDTLRSLNGIATDETLIQPGQTLKVTGTPKTTTTTSNTTTQAANTNSTAATQSSTTTASKVTVSTNHVTYTVKSGDTLYTIAQAYGVTVASLRAANTLGSTLVLGQTLTINDPTKTPATTSSAASSTSTVASSSSTASTTTGTSSTNNTTSSSAVSSSSQATQSSTAATSSSSAATSSSTSTTTSSVSASSIVSYAEQLATMGIPYVSGGTSLSGFDCSGFTQYVYAHFGISIPRTSEAQSAIGTYESVSAAQPGDLLFWGGRGSAWHVGIYVGGTSYVAAPTTGETVSLKSFQYFQPSFAVHVN
ncbi:MAG: LysM peptidoglycan-binding domain-containing protein [Liquorilactobacillus satsumensis]|uniref:C40 family peptidase n=1 Tax=Liquorilactobacillus satsumensis TaxID=259059 RepID=UPI0039ECD6E9